MERRNNILGFIIYALVALILLLCGWWPAALILLLIYGLVLLMYKHNKKAQWLIDGDPSDKMPMEAVVSEYGEPEDAIIIDASRANEPVGVILLYPSQGFLVANGRRIPFEAITGVSAKNSATPYTTGPYQILINTRDKLIGTLRLNAGYDGQMATEAAARVYHSIKDSLERKQPS